MSFRESLAWSTVWITVALAFNYGFYTYATHRFGDDVGTRLGLEFLTGYVVEKSLAIDNIFVFVLVFAYFGIPLQYQHRALFYGILGALVFRALFIALGSVLMQYKFIVLIFGAFLILTGLKMLRAPGQKVDPEKNGAIRLFKRWVPVTSELHGPAKRSFAQMSMYSGGGLLRVEARSGVFDAWTEAVSPDYFDIVGARPSAGRFFSDSDDAVVVLGEVWAQ